MAQLLRRLFRARSFTVSVIATLALGIGAGSAIFTVLDSVLLRPLPFPDADRLVTLWHRGPGLGIERFEQSDASYLTYRRLGRSFAGMGIYQETVFNLTGAGDPLRVKAGLVSGSLFTVLQRRPALGGLWTDAAEAVGGPRPVLVSHGLWEGRLGADAAVVGRRIELDGVGREIVGVMPADFEFPDRETEIWLPYVFNPDNLARVSFNFDVVARLRPGVSPAEAEQELAGLLHRIPELYPAGLTPRLIEDIGMGAMVVPLREFLVGDVIEAFWPMAGMIGFVLLIACANVANLFLIRAEDRRREAALRTALGADRLTLARHFLAESLALGLAAGAGALAVATALTSVVVRLGGSSVPRLSEVGADSMVALLTLAAAAASGAICGSLPWVRRGAARLTADLNESGRSGSSSRRSSRLRSALVVAQVALALLLVAGSGLMARSLWKLQQVPLGFEPANLLTLRLTLPPGQYPDEEIAAFLRGLLERTRALAGVQQAGAVDGLPLTGYGNNNGVRIEDFPLEEGALPPVFKTRSVTSGYFEAMGIPLLQGRVLTEADNENRTAALVISESIARRYWPDQSPLGKRIQPYDSTIGRWHTIVGVVGDVRDDGLRRAEEQILYHSVLSPGRQTEASMSLVVRTSVPPSAILPPLQELIWDMDPKLPVANVEQGDNLVNRAMARTRLTLMLLAMSATLSLLLGAVGLYGVVAWAARRRTREIGIRMALGADSPRIRWMVLRQALVSCTAGILIGAAAALGLSRFMSRLLFETSASDPVSWGVGIATLLAVSLAAAYFPAHRAARVPPLEALRPD